MCACSPLYLLACLAVITREKCSGSRLLCGSLWLVQCVPPRALYLPDPFLLLIHEPTPTNPCQSDPKRTLRHWLNTRQAAIEGKRKGEELRNHPVPVFKGDALRERGVAVATSNETAFF